MRILVTGGAGFLGSAIIRAAIRRGYAIFNIDTHNLPAGRPCLEGANKSASYSQLLGDVTDSVMLTSLMREFRPDAIIHTAYESPRREGDIAKGALMTSLTTLEACAAYVSGLPEAQRADIRFILPVAAQIYGALEPDELGHDVDAIPVPETRLSGMMAANIALAEGMSLENGFSAMSASLGQVYGPWQTQNSFIAHILQSALSETPISIADGHDVFEWVHVDDAANGILQIAQCGQASHAYQLGAHTERRKIDVARAICLLLDGKRRRENGASYCELLPAENDTFPAGRRYGMDSRNSEKLLDWQAQIALPVGLSDTLNWHLDHAARPRHAANAG